MKKLLFQRRYCQLAVNFLRFGLLLSVFFILANHAYASPPGNKPYDKSYKQPEWLSEGPIVMVGNWDAAPIFRLRKGGNPEWHHEEYAREHTEDAVIKLKEMGVTLAIIHFYKGFGLEAEKEQLEDSRKLAALCKKHGIRVGVYVGSTVVHETILEEKPDAEEWFVPDYFGQPVRYGGTQTFRKRVYFRHPGFVEYMKKVVRIAIEELKVDLIHFDNTSSRTKAPVYSHPMAIKNFRSYLTENYEPETLKKLLGFSTVSYIEPPLYDQPLSEINDPMFQLWTNFRCQELAEFYKEMEIFIHGLNPEVVVENNPGGMYGINTMWLNGVDHSRLLQNTDIIWTEEGSEASVRDGDVIISKIRSYKMGRSLKNIIFTYTGNSSLEMAEAMAYNRHCIGMVGGMLAGYELEEDRTRIGFDNPYTWGAFQETKEVMEAKAKYIRFYQKNFKYFQNVENIADVAILHNYNTMALNSDRPYQSTFLYEQALIQSRIPFDIIFDEHLKDLSKYRVLVLADQKCLSDKQSDLIRKFVHGGNGLVLTEYTSLFTETNRRKRDFGLKDLIGQDAPPWRGGRAESRNPLADLTIVQKKIGKGRVVYLPEIKPAVPKPPTASMSSQYWKLPINFEEMLEAVQWAAGTPLTMNINAPLTVATELTVNPDSSSYMVHLLNYDVENTPEVRDIQVKLFLPPRKRIKRCTLLSPDHKNTQNLMFDQAGQTITFTVPKLNTYNMIVAEL